ncbi:hypothetical protein [Fortiea contorta]|uniref:hypothetical protein n=1 Tax=Fortiea contorta TaxID=1892405 RepID=UPI00036DCF5C|nr:hypothetical protein [Fortiea contorta]
MTQLTFDQFVHPLSEFPNVVSLNGAEEPMLDMYTMASMILYSACANNNLGARENTLEALANNGGLVDVNSLFERCQMGDRGAILQTITLIVSSLETKIEHLKLA